MRQRYFTHAVQIGDSDHYEVHNRRRTYEESTPLVLGCFLLQVSERQ